MSTLKVNSIRGTGASSDAISVNSSDGTCTVKATNNLSNRNLIINGAMQCAQYGQSSTTAGYGSLDRFQGVSGGGEEACTHSQHALTSSDTGPWAAGFRNSFHLQNGNQTGGAGSNDYAYIGYTIEAQDIATSGWDYNSASSYLTLSFWVKSSVAGQQYGYLYTADGTSQGFSFSVGNLSADTWSKVTVNIPGHANLTFDNDNGGGLYMYWGPHWGSDYTNSGNTLLTWAAYSSSNRTPDFPTTWWTTNDATFELTGVQLEVGDVATDFEHRSYGDELRRCQRYFYRHVLGSWNGNGKSSITDNASMYNATICFLTVPLPVTMRAEPTLGTSNSSNYYEAYINGASVTFDTWGLDGVSTKRCLTINATLPSVTAGASALVRTDNAAAFLDAIAEL